MGIWAKYWQCVCKLVVSLLVAEKLAISSDNWYLAADKCHSIPLLWCLNVCCIYLNVWIFDCALQFSLRAHRVVRWQMAVHLHWQKFAYLCIGNGSHNWMGERVVLCEQLRWATFVFVCVHKTRVINFHHTHSHRNTQKYIEIHANFDRQMAIRAMFLHLAKNNNNKQQI